MNSVNSIERAKMQNHAKAKRVASLRAMGLSVKETANEVGCAREQVRTLQLLGERLLSIQLEQKP